MLEHLNDKDNIIRQENPGVFPDDLSAHRYYF